MLASTFQAVQVSPPQTDAVVGVEDSQRQIQQLPKFSLTETQLVGQVKMWTRRFTCVSQRFAIYIHSVENDTERFSRFHVIESVSSFEESLEGGGIYIRLAKILSKWWMAFVLYSSSYLRGKDTTTDA